MGVAQSTRSVTRDTLTKHVTPSVNNNSTTLAQNLKKIGQVNVQSPASRPKTHVLRTRALSESSSSNGRTIDSFGLSQLLDARKDADASTPAKAQQQLAEQYRLDEGVVQRLAKRYNTPSVGRENTIELQDGDRRLYREAIWVEAGQAKSQVSNM